MSEEERMRRDFVALATEAANLRAQVQVYREALDDAIAFITDHPARCPNCEQCKALAYKFMATTPTPAEPTEP